MFWLTTHFEIWFLFWLKFSFFRYLCRRLDPTGHSMLHTHPGFERPPQNVTDYQNTFAERDGDLPSSTGSLCPIWDRRASSRPCNIWDSGQICCWASIFFFVKCLYFIFCAGSPWWPQRCRNTRWLLDWTWRHVNWKSLCSEGEK